MRNMIIAVGPGTPASVLWQTGAERDDEVAVEEVFDDMEDSSSMSEDEEDDPIVVAAGQRDEGEQESHGGGGDEDGSDGMDTSEGGGDANAGDEDGDGDADEGDDTALRRERLLREDIAAQVQAQVEARVEARVREFFLSHLNQNESDMSSDEENEERHGRGWTRSTERHPSLRHGGCINTACWLDCPWQLSSAGNGASVMYGSSNPSSVEAIASNECPTQLITSGDDRLIKVWDVKDAMGCSNPLEDGWDTFSPLANMPKPDSTSVQKAWKGYYRKRPYSKMAGSVVHLATLVSGHRGNVFHVTPVEDEPGKILTCGADGALRLSDLQSESSSVVASLGDRTQFLFHPTMAFSHVFLTNNTGLLCSEEGLHRFDLRLSPREQERRSLLSGLDCGLSSDYCKSCAIWSPSFQNSTRKAADTSSWIESNYVFAGGRSEFVGLLDLRMTGVRSRVVQSYRPKTLKETVNVSVSGLDVSKDGRELLVSYESDQIYSFPILHACASKAGPTLGEIDAFVDCSDKPVNELASYGGHLNRFTFLKNAKYAGPNDEYIVTGSDSGCGWIYERKTGAVVSLLGADKCTCNGVVPHPVLPFFISYGIDSTAKLWRATTPVSLKADDTPTGRAQCSLDQEYEMSPLARNWDTVQKFVERNASPGMLPDFVASPAEMATSYRFSPRESRAICGVSSPKFGNALRLLPSILRRNRHECYRSFQRSNTTVRAAHDTPVEQSPEEFTHRVSLSRLYLQATRLGLVFDPRQPWAFRSSIARLDQQKEEPNWALPDVHPADCVPDNPSDWLLWDPAITGLTYEQKNFNRKEYRDILIETVREDFREEMDPNSGNGLPPWLVGCDLPSDDTVESNQWALEISDDPFVTNARRILFATIDLLKKGGNVAMKEGHYNAAARRYDKALQYCAFAFMKHEQSRETLVHLSCRNPTETKKKEDHDLSLDDSDDEEDMSSTAAAAQKKPSTSNTPLVWTPLLHLLVTTRLNMALLLLRPENLDAGRAVDQAFAALDFLRPFMASSSSGTTESTKTKKEDSSPPKAIHTLAAKAHFRLGSAKLELGNLKEAIENFEIALKESKTSDSTDSSKPDALVKRKLNEAKRKLTSKQKRDKARYKRALEQSGDVS